MSRIGNDSIEGAQLKKGKRKSKNISHSVCISVIKQGKKEKTYLQLTYSDCSNHVWMQRTEVGGHSPASVNAWSNVAALLAVSAAI
jgi:hypothetical protein